MKRRTRGSAIRGGKSVRRGGNALRLLDNLESRLLFSTVNVAPVTVTEGDTTAYATLTATLDHASTSAVTLKYATANGSAKKGLDYTKTNSTLVIPADQTSGTFSIPILANNVYQGTTQFYLNLSVNAGNTLQKQRVAVTVQDNDAMPTISVSDVSVNATNHSQIVKIPVTLSNASSKGVTLHYTTTNVTAMQGEDYRQAKKTLVIKPGATTGYMKVRVSKDANSQTDKAFNVQLTHATNATVTATGNDPEYARIAVLNNPGINVVRPTMTVSDATTIAGGDAVFNVTLSQAATQNVTVRYRTVTASADAPNYTPVDGILTIPAGSTTGIITVQTQMTNGIENTAFTLALTAPANADLTNTSATGTIIAILPTVSVSNVSVPEGDSGTSMMAFTVTLSNASVFPVTVNYATSDGTATVGSDYAAANGTLTFAPGETTKTINVTVNGDTTVESDKTLNLTLSDATNATIDQGTAVGTILNDDVAGISISSSTTAALLDGPTKKMAFTVTLSTPSAVPVSVDYATANGTAEAGSAYNAANGTLTFMPGETSKTIIVTLNNNNIPYTTESFSVNLTNATNGTITTGTGVGTIQYAGTDISDNLMSLPTGTLPIGDGEVRAESFTTGSRSSLLTEVTLQFQNYQPGTAVVAIYNDNDGQPGTLVQTLTAQDGNLPQGISGDVNFTAEGFVLNPNSRYWVVVSTVDGDLLVVNTSENLNATGSGFTGAMAISADSGEHWQVNDSSTMVMPPISMDMRVIAKEVAVSFPSISIQPASVNEDPTDPAAEQMTFTVTLSQASNMPVNVSYATSDDTAVAGQDYDATSGQLTFAPGETSKTITVAVYGDSTGLDESLNMTLSNASFATIQTPTAAGTISTDVDLSNNLGSSELTMASLDDGDFALGFNTGSSAVALLNVNVMLNGDLTGLTATVYSDNWGTPGLMIGALSTQAISSDGTSPTTFTASGLILNANSSYWIVLHSSTETQLQLTDGSAQSGIGYNGELISAPTSADWEQVPFSPLMQVLATPITFV